MLVDSFSEWNLSFLVEFLICRKCLLSFLYAASLLAPLVLFKHRSFIRMQRARLLSLKTLRVAFLALLARRRLARPIRADFPKPNARQLFRPTRSLQCSCTLTLLALSRHPLWNILPLALAVVCLTSAWVQDRGDSLASLEIRRSRRTATPFATLARTNFQRLVKKGSQSLDFLQKKPLTRSLSLNSFRLQRACVRQRSQLVAFCHQLRLFWARLNALEYHCRVFHYSSVRRLDSVTALRRVCRVHSDCNAHVVRTKVQVSCTLFS